MTIHVKHLEQCQAHSKYSINVTIIIHPNPILQAQPIMVKNCQCFSIYSSLLLSLFYKSQMKWASEIFYTFSKELRFAEVEWTDPRS